MIVKIVLIALCSMILSNMLKEIKPEFSIYITISTNIIMLYIILYYLKPMHEMLSQKILEYNLDNELISTVIKICAVEYLKVFIINICTDYGYKSLADKVDFAARITMLSMCFPWIFKVLVDINKLL